MRALGGLCENGNVVSRGELGERCLCTQARPRMQALSMTSTYLGQCQLMARVRMRAELRVEYQKARSCRKEAWAFAAGLISSGRWR